MVSFVFRWVRKTYVSTWFPLIDDKHPDRAIIQDAIIVPTGSLPAMLPDPEAAPLLVCPVYTTRYANGLHI